MVASPKGLGPEKDCAGKASGHQDLMTDRQSQCDFELIQTPC
jgi:hypothetical protein